MSDKKKYKIVISGRDVIGTGGGTVAISTIREFLNQGHEVVFVVDYSLPFFINGLKVVVTPMGGFLKKLTPKTKIGSRLKHFLQVLLFSIFGRIAVRKYEKQGFLSIDHNCEAFGGDIVVLHNVFIEMYKSDKRPFIKKIPQFFNPLFSYRLFRERIIFKSKRIKGVIAVSPQTLNEALPYLKYKEIKTSILNGVDIDRFCPLGVTETDISLKTNDQRVILFVGHEFERKKLLPIIEALSLLPSNYLLWVIGGRFSNVDHYISICKELNLIDRVKFLGTISQPEKYFRSSDVFVLPSDYEASPLVVLEAMASGVPALVTPVGSAVEIIENGVNGYIVSATAADIAEKIKSVFVSNDHYIEMKLAARKTAEHYSWQNIANKYLEVVDSVSKENDLNGR